MHKEEANRRATSITWWLTVACAVIPAVSLYRFAHEPVGSAWMLLLAVAVVLASGIEVALPGTRSKIKLTDTFVYLGVIVLSPWSAALLGIVDGLSTRRRKRTTRRTSVVNAGALGISVLAAALVARSLFGPLDVLARGSSSYPLLLAALFTLCAVMFVVNTGLIAAVAAGGVSSKALREWRRHYFWTFPIFGLQMVGAALIAALLSQVGFYSVLASLLVLIVTHASIRLLGGRLLAAHNRISALHSVNLATIESLTLAIDAADPLVRGHIQRVSALAVGLARATDYPEDQIEGLNAAALLHDIGKLAVPEYILNKPGKLSSAEYSKVMEHPVVGADILSSVEFPYEVVPIVKHHHERFDGTGYPSGLKGEQIPLGARILAIVDCYDALTTIRPYRACYARDVALDMLRAESGRAYDPVLLSKFLETVDDLEAALPFHHQRPVAFAASGRYAAPRLVEPRVVLAPGNDAERALRDIASAQREALSLYEISQTLGSTLKLSDVLPIVAAKLEGIANFTTLVIYLADGTSLQAAYVIGRNSEAIKGTEINIGEGGVGWSVQHNQAVIGGPPFLNLELALGNIASEYRSSAIFPLMRDSTLVGALALYSEETRGYSRDEIRLLETIAGHAAAAVHNARIFERTQESALTDNLTGLPNSRYMYSFFDQERSRAERHGYALMLMMMDLDGFKKVNDTYGHHVGDEILRQIAKIARAQLRSGDTLVRYAGDEFVAVLHRATPEVVAELKARLQAAVDAFVHEVRPGRVARVGISVGNATYGVDGFAIDELMEVADQRMYEDKLARRLSLAAHPVPELSLRTAM